MTKRPEAGHRGAPLLEGALLFTIAAHAAGMLSMALLLLPGMPGGPQPDVALRAAHIAHHPWLWRLGWLPWQITAASDVLLCIALLCTPWIPRLPAVLSTVATLAAIIPDQTGQFDWTWHGVSLAESAVQSGSFDAYANYESSILQRTAGWGPIGYILGAIGWTWCFASAGVWSRRLTWLSVAAWGTFAAATGALFLPEEVRRQPVVPVIVSIGNGAAFVLLMWWLANVAEAVMRRSRPDTTHGGLAPWRHPSGGLWARACDVVANSRLARAFGRWLPSLAMASDITDVVYVNYLVESRELERFVSPPLALQRLGPDGRFALFTFLTFRHGHFGPACFGPLRWLWPSPIQSNWRIHVYEPATGTRGIQFLTTAIASTPHAIVTRLLASGVPMHVPDQADVRRIGGGDIEVLLEPGHGTAPDANGLFHPGVELELPSPWDRCFANWRDMLAYCVPQDRAMCVDPATGRVSCQEITLGIALDKCRPLAGRPHSKAAQAIAGDAEPLCFAVDRVRFRFHGGGKRSRPATPAGAGNAAQ